MTSQSKTFIELSDIIGMRLECKTCGVSILINQPNLSSTTDKHNTALRSCPTCTSSWTHSEGHSVSGGMRPGFDTEIKEMIRAIATVRDLQEKLGCNLTLEITAQSESRKESDK